MSRVRNVDRREDDRGGVCFADVGLCWICGGPTHRVDLCFESHVCYRCGPKADEHYWAAVRDYDNQHAPLGHTECSLCGTMSRANR